LWTLVKKEGKKFSGSTSSLSGMLSQIYFLVSGDRRVDISTLSLAFKKEVGFLCQHWYLLTELILP